MLNYYIKPLTFLINQYFHDGIFPYELKLAKCIPIYKSGSTVEVNNYRPISVLNIFSKIFDIIEVLKIIKYFFTLEDIIQITNRRYYIQLFT